MSDAYKSLTIEELHELHAEQQEQNQPTFIDGVYKISNLEGEEQFYDKNSETNYR